MYPGGAEWSSCLPLQAHAVSFLSCLSPLFSHMATVQSPRPHHTASTTELLCPLLLPPGFLSSPLLTLGTSSGCQPGASVLRKRPPVNMPFCRLVSQHQEPLLVTLTRIMTLHLSVGLFDHCLSLLWILEVRLGLIALSSSFSSPLPHFLCLSQKDCLVNIC